MPRGLERAGQYLIPKFTVKDCVRQQLLSNKPSQVFAAQHANCWFSSRSCVLPEEWAGLGGLCHTSEVTGPRAGFRHYHLLEMAAPWRRWREVRGGQGPGEGGRGEQAEQRGVSGSETTQSDARMMDTCHSLHICPHPWNAHPRNAHPQNTQHQEGTVT